MLDIKSIECFDVRSIDAKVYVVSLVKNNLPTLSPEFRPLLMGATVLIDGVEMHVWAIELFARWVACDHDIIGLAVKNKKPA